MKQKYLLLEDILSSMRSKVIYGRKGEQVTEISRSDVVLIVEGKSGRFPVHVNRLTPINQ